MASGEATANHSPGRQRFALAEKQRPGLSDAHQSHSTHGHGKPAAQIEVGVNE